MCKSSAPKFMVTCIQMVCVAHRSQLPARNLLEDIEINRTLEKFGRLLDVLENTPLF